MKRTNSNICYRRRFLLVLISLLLLTSACDQPSIVPPASTESTSPNVDLLNEDLQLQAPLVLGNIRFDHITVEDGLSQNGAFAILQDSDGFMWFGTQDGLDKYDGQSFTAYRHDPDNANSPSDNWIWALHEDQSGTLWIGTLNGGLNRYDRETGTFTHYQNDPDNPQSLSHNEVLAIYEDSDSFLWIGTRVGLDRFDNETESFTHYPQITDAVHAIHQTQDGLLWVGTEGGGFNRFNLETESITQFLNNANDPQSLIDNNIWTIYEDSFDILWLGTDAGLERFDRESGTFNHHQNNPADPQSLSFNSIRTIYEDPWGALWIGTDGGGLDRFDRETEAFSHFQYDPGDPDSLSHYSVYDLFQDQEGVLWIGTYGGGIDKLFWGSLDYAYFKHNHNKPNSLSDNDIRGIYEDQSGMLWVGTNGGLNRFDRKTGQWHHYQHDPDDPFSISSNVVGDVLEDRDGLLWVGTMDHGLNRYDPETEHFTRYQNDPNDPTSLRGSFISGIIQDRQGILWIGSMDGGLNSYDPESGYFTHYLSDANDPDSIYSDNIFTIYEDHQGWLWIGTFGDGLNRYDRANNKFTNYQTDPNDSSSLNNNLVTSILEDSEGTLWIGTAGGLNKFDRETETFTHYREKDGLPNDLIVGILEDEGGNLWLSTNHGLSTFNPQTETFTNFDVNDGLQSNEFNGIAYHKSNSGEVFFGGIRGLNAFYPDRIQENNLYVPEVALTRLTQGSEDIELDQPINYLTEMTLYWPDNYFEFEFAALSFAQPDKNQYAYILEGLDDNWNEIGTRNYGKYTHLPGGTYTLRLKGSNNDGVWNETGTAIEITIVPPFWETWVFRGIVLLAITGGITGFHSFRVQRTHTRNRELEKLVEERTTELRERVTADAVAEERNRLARDLHDAVSQSLFSASLISEALPEVLQSNPDSVESLLQKLRILSRGALAEMRNLLMELRPDALLDAPLKDLLEQLGQAATGREGFSASITADKCDLPDDVHIVFYRIAQESLNNIVKYAEANQVEISVRCKTNEVSGDLIQAEILICDDGVGFDLADTPSERFGLKIMEERCAAVGAVLTIKSKPGDGTQVHAMWKESELNE